MKPVMWSGSFWVSVRFWYYKTINEAESLQNGKWAFFPLPLSPSVVKSFMSLRNSHFLLYSLTWGMWSWSGLSWKCGAHGVPVSLLPLPTWNRKHLAPHASLGLIMVSGVVLFLQRRAVQRGMGAEEGFIRSITKGLCCTVQFGRCL